VGRRNRERAEKILAGDESGRVRHKVARKAVNLLQALSTRKQVEFLSESLRTGRLSPDELRGQLMANAHEEMRKGITKLHRKNREITVDKLLEEYRKETEFRELAEKVGLDEDYFIDVAGEEMRRFVVGV
jgi:hypothetical protein